MIVLMPTDKMEIISEIHGYSLDFDGCFGIQHVRDFDTFLARHDSFIGEFKKKVKLTDKSVFFVGSNRQHGSLDIIGDEWNKNGLALSFIPRLAESLGGHFDDYLLSDTIDSLPTGSTYQSFIALAMSTLALDLKKDKLPPNFQALKEKMNEATTHHCDHVKLDIIYAQVHKIAIDYPDKNITFNFYDDRPHILDSLYQYLSTHPHCLPSNLTLCLHLYKRGIPTKTFDSILGTGDIDLGFENTVLKMGAEHFAYVEKRAKTSTQDPSFFQIDEYPDFTELFSVPDETFLKDRETMPPTDSPLPSRTPFAH